MINDEMAAAAEVLESVYGRGAYSSIELSRAFREGGARDGATRIVYGVLERDTELEYIISALAERRPAPRIEVILKIALYCIKYMDGIPDHAAVNCAVELAGKVKPQLKGFVNALLKKFINDGVAPPRGEKERISVEYSYPLWLVNAYIKQYGKDTAAAIMSAKSDGCEHLRPNTRKTDLNAIRSMLDGKGIGCVPSEVGGLYVRNCGYVRKLFEDGYVTFQGVSSMLCCKALAPNGSGRLLDMCAAPGGKSVYINELAPSLKITACDVHKHRVDLINKYAFRMGAKGIKAIVADAAVKGDDLNGSFDYVLADVPCSGFGAAYKKPDILINRTMNDVIALSELQYKILDNACDHAKRGGVVVYSTCTTLREENYNVVGKLLKYRQDVRLEKIEGIGYDNDGSVQILPDGRKDGFFIARLRKI